MNVCRPIPRNNSQSMAQKLLVKDDLAICIYFKPCMLDVERKVLFGENSNASVICNIGNDRKTKNTNSTAAISEKPLNKHRLPPKEKEHIGFHLN